MKKAILRVYSACICVGVALAVVSLGLGLFDQTEAALLVGKVAALVAACALGTVVVGVVVSDARRL